MLVYFRHARCPPGGEIFLGQRPPCIFGVLEVSVPRYFVRVQFSLIFKGEFRSVMYIILLVIVVADGCLFVLFETGVPCTLVGALGC